MREVAKLIEAVNKADSADKLLDAVENLADIGSELAIPTLIEVLGFNNPGAAVAAVEGLIKLGEPAVPYLMNNLDDYNYGARAWSIRAFAGIGDPIALDLLLKAAVTDFSQSVRRAAVRGLGIIRWSKLPPQEILPRQQETLKTMLLATNDGEWVVRYAAVVGLEFLGQTVGKIQPEFLEQIKLRFQEIKESEVETAICARIQLAWENLKG